MAGSLRNLASTGVPAEASKASFSAGLDAKASSGVPAEVKKPAERLTLYEGW
jgi:hypothetical protein